MPYVTSNNRGSDVFLEAVKEGISEGLSSAATNLIYKEGYQDGLNGNHRNMSLCKN